MFFPLSVAAAPTPPASACEAETVELACVVAKPSAVCCVYWGVPAAVEVAGGGARCTAMLESMWSPNATLAVPRVCACEVAEVTALKSEMGLEGVTESGGVGCPTPDCICESTDTGAHGPAHMCASFTLAVFYTRNFLLGTVSSIRNILRSAGQRYAFFNI